MKELFRKFNDLLKEKRFVYDKPRSTPGTAGRFDAAFGEGAKEIAPESKDGRAVQSAVDAYNISLRKKKPSGTEESIMEKAHKDLMEDPRTPDGASNYIRKNYKAVKKGDIFQVVRTTEVVVLAEDKAGLESTATGTAEEQVDESVATTTEKGDEYAEKAAERLEEGRDKEREVLELTSQEMNSIDDLLPKGIEHLKKMTADSITEERALKVFIDDIHALSELDDSKVTAYIKSKYEIKKVREKDKLILELSLRGGRKVAAEGPPKAVMTAKEKRAAAREAKKLAKARAKAEAEAKILEEARVREVAKAKEAEATRVRLEEANDRRVDRVNKLTENQFSDLSVLIRAIPKFKDEYIVDLFDQKPSPPQEFIDTVDRYLDEQAERATPLDKKRIKKVTTKYDELKRLYGEAKKPDIEDLLEDRKEEMEDINEKWKIIVKGKLLSAHHLRIELKEKVGTFFFDINNDIATVKRELAGKKAALAEKAPAKKAAPKKKTEKWVSSRWDKYETANKEPFKTLEAAGKIPEKDTLDAKSEKLGRYKGIYDFLYKKVFNEVKSSRNRRILTLQACINLRRGGEVNIDKVDKEGTAECVDGRLTVKDKDGVVTIEGALFPAEEPTTEELAKKPKTLAELKPDVREVFLRVLERSHPDLAKNKDKKANQDRINEYIREHYSYKDTKPKDEQEWDNTIGYLDHAGSPIETDPKVLAAVNEALKTTGEVDVDDINVKKAIAHYGGAENLRTADDWKAALSKNPTLAQAIRSAASAEPEETAPIRVAQAELKSEES